MTISHDESFQLAIITPRETLIGYDIATAQSWLNILNAHLLESSFDWIYFHTINTQETLFVLFRYVLSIYNYKRPIYYNLL